MFKKVAFACAALALTSAQSLSDLANQANAALAPVLAQENPIVQHGDAISLNVNNYEWTLTEQDGEYELSVSQLANNLNNLAPALSALLANAGASAQANNGLAGDILASEAASVGVDIENAGAGSQALGAQLSENSAAITELAEQQYQQVAAALASNQNGLTDQVNQQLNEAVQNQESLSAAVANGVNAAVANAGAVENLAAANVGSLPVQVSGNTEALSAAAVNAAGNLNAEQAAATVNGLANQALNSGVNAANANLPSGLSSSVQGAASDAAQSAAAGLSSAANSLGVNNINSAADAANLVNNQ